jgi:hypothetical protein
MNPRLLGMYVHQHWSFAHPYAARTWTLADWQGYAAGLAQLGYNALLIWPVLEVMPDPLTPSDAAHLDKLARVIDYAHDELGLRVWLALCPNVGVRQAQAQAYPLEQRPFFYCDTRVDPGDPAALAALVQRREELLRPLARADAVTVIDSDPGGYPGATTRQFVDLLLAHRRLLDRLRPGIELVYWHHVGWQAYSDFYRTGTFRWGTPDELRETLSLLAQAAPEPWGLANGLEVATELGLAERVISFRYGAVEGEPTYPLTNCTPAVAAAAAQSPAPRGVMANAQAHCLQLPHTWAFARAARGLAVDDVALAAFAEDLLPGVGGPVVAAWQALASGDPDAAEAAVATLAGPWAATPPGALAGLLFGSVERFRLDLVAQLQMRAAWARLDAATQAAAGVPAALSRALAALRGWQDRHQYLNAWNRPELEAPLRRLGHPAVDAALACTRYLGAGDTPFARIQDGYRQVETFGPRLLSALAAAVPP